MPNTLQGGAWSATLKGLLTRGWILEAGGDHLLTDAGYATIGQQRPSPPIDIFLKILTMDDDGTWQRCKPAAQPKITRAAFDALPYAKRLTDCERRENIDGPTASAWAEINAHLGTTASKLAELVEQLGQSTFGHTPRVGDSFCGGGSIPFEAFGSDLNPVAGLLTRASLNLLGGGKPVQE